MSHPVARFRQYEHLERLDHRNVDGLTTGRVHVFPKLDGTNGSVWFDGEKVCCASRSRVLSPESDNAGFAKWLAGDSIEAARIPRLVQRHPWFILYGEWLVPHTLKTYRPEAWRRFWIFDVFDLRDLRYLPHGYSSALLREYDVDYVECLGEYHSPSDEQLQAAVQRNTFLIAEGAGIGEGIVLKNYDWWTPHATWAKLVTNDFKEKNRKVFGHANNGSASIEAEIAEQFVTPHLVGKTRAKVAVEIANEEDADITLSCLWIEATYRDRFIPQLLGRVWHDLVNEEMWAILKKHKSATINFKRLQAEVVRVTKSLAQDLFA